MSTHDTSITILVRPTGEIALKARGTRSRFQKRLLRNLEEALEEDSIEFVTRHEWGRIFLDVDSPSALEVIARVFGVKSISPIDATTQASLAAIVVEGERIFADRVRGRTFAVRARRAGTHSFSSGDVNRELGTALSRFGRVDLGSPDVTVRVEVRDEVAYLFSEAIPGPGGLPLGVEGKAVALISGGFDSAVAAWMILKRGVALDYVFLNLAGAAYERSVLAVAHSVATRWSYGTAPCIHVVQAEGVLAELRRSVRESYQQVVLKRLMYRAGEAIAARVGAHAIVTGESIGQVSSQTLPNLNAIGAGLTLPVLRPLVGFDKEEIIEKSRELGTYSLSEKVQEYCALDIDKPVTGATPKRLANEEADFDLSLLDEAVEAARVVELKGLAALDLTIPYLYVEDVPSGAQVIDTRSAEDHAAWHYPGARHFEHWDLLRGYSRLDRAQTFVLYCDVGLKSARLAEEMQRAGYEAYSFKGGAAALKKRTEGAGAGAGAIRTIDD